MDRLSYYFHDLVRLLEAVPVHRLDTLVGRLLQTYQDGHQLFFLGNGGSAATCSHIVNDFQKCIYLAGGQPFRALALTDSVPLITAWANDTAYEHVFAEQLRAWVRPGDMVFCLSGSGNSPNVLRAATLAREVGAYVVALCGHGGGKLAPLAHEALVVPSENMQRIEDVHMAILHALFWRMEEVLRAGAATPAAEETP